jgi:hypothetical protein
MISLTRARPVAGIGAAAAIAALGVAAAVITPTTARAAAFVGVGIGVPFGLPFYYPPYPPLAYYPPPPCLRRPITRHHHPHHRGTPTAAPAPSITYTPHRAWTDAAGRQCREYKATREFNGRPATQVHGTACRDPDGQWRIVN